MLVIPTREIRQDQDFVKKFHPENALHE